MKSLQNISSGLFVLATYVLSIVAIMGVWSVLDQDVITKSFETISLLALVAMVIIVAGRYVDKTAIEDPMANASTAAGFNSVRNITLGVLIVAVALFALMGLLAIWDVLAGDVTYKALSSIGIIGFASLISVMVCFERENKLLGRPSSHGVSGGSIVVMFILFWIFVSISGAMFSNF